MVSEDEVAAEVACGPDPAVHLAAIRRYIDAGFDHVYLYQVGPDQEGFLDFVATELLAVLDKVSTRPRAAAAR